MNLRITAYGFLPSVKRLLPISLSLLAIPAGGRQSPAETFCEITGCLDASKPNSAVIKAALEGFKTCANTKPDSACNAFVSDAITKLYGINDFKDFGIKGAYKSANELADFLATAKNWTLLGEATSAEALAEATHHVNTGSPTVAVRKSAPGEKFGHIAVLLPGPGSASGNWHQAKPVIPCAASFFLDEPEKAVIGCKLSYAFPSEKGILLYGRN
jgi:hypothetical protein